MGKLHFRLGAFVSSSFKTLGRLSSVLSSCQSSAAMPLSMRSMSFKPLPWLALAAALLLAIASPVTRFLAPSLAAFPAGMDCHSAVSSSAGLETVPGKPHGLPSPAGEDNHCPYCLLAAHLWAGSSYYLDIPTQFSNEILAALEHPPATRALENIRSLGSQAPPTG